jgi:hypothetical protein
MATLIFVPAVFALVHGGKKQHAKQIDKELDTQLA